PTNRRPGAAPAPTGTTLVTRRTAPRRRTRPDPAVGRSPRDARAAARGVARGTALQLPADQPATVGAAVLVPTDATGRRFFGVHFAARILPDLAPDCYRRP